MKPRAPANRRQTDGRGTPMEFEPSVFFNSIRPTLGPFTQKQVDGINDLLTFVKGDPNITNVHWVAYMFATVKHETAHTYRPIKEFGLGKGHEYGKLVTVTNDAGKQVKVAYYGRGFVQLTWRANYVKMGKLLNLDLEGNPDKALDPQAAYQIMSIGMRDGLFTGKKLSDYIHGTVTDF